VGKLLSLALSRSHAKKARKFPVSKKLKLMDKLRTLQDKAYGFTELIIKEEK